MWIVRRSEMGRLAYGRMVRDRVVLPLLPGIALPLDVPDSLAIRRHVLTECLPAGLQASGAAALWAHGSGAAPEVIDVRCSPGRHVRNWVSPVPLRFHGVGIAAPSGPIAERAVAAADAARWGDAPSAVTDQYGRRLAPVSRRAS